MNDRLLNDVLLNDALVPISVFKPPFPQCLYLFHLLKQPFHSWLAKFRQPQTQPQTQPTSSHSNHYHHHGLLLLQTIWLRPSTAATPSTGRLTIALRCLLPLLADSSRHIQRRAHCRQPSTPRQRPIWQGKTTPRTLLREHRIDRGRPTSEGRVRRARVRMWLKGNDNPLSQ